MEPRNSQAFTCPHCGVRCLLGPILGTSAGGQSPSYREAITLTDDEEDTYETTVQMTHQIFHCPGCRKHTYILYREAVKVAGSLGVGVTAELPGEVVHQWPVLTPTRHEAVPAEVAAATDEAARCLSVGAHNACAVMARRAMDAICLDREAKGSTLYERLKFLKEEHEITDDLWEWAEEMRIGGRSGAHPEWEEVTAEDADHAVRFIHEIIRYLYINPAELKARRLKGSKKKK